MLNKEDLIKPDLGQYAGVKVEINTIKPTFNNISKIIKWTSSKYNERTKKDVVLDILSKYNQKFYGIYEFRCGSYSEGNHNRGKQYVYYSEQIDDKLVAYIICNYFVEDIKVYKLEDDN